QISQIQTVVEAVVDARQPARDLAGDEGLAANRRLVIEENAAAGKHPVCLAVIHRYPVTIHLGGPVGRARIEGRGLLLRYLLHLAEHLRRRGLIEARLLLQPQDTDGLEQPQSAERIGIGRVFRRLERDSDMTLGREVVDLVRQHLLNYPNQVRGVRQVSVMQVQLDVALVRILIEVVYPIRVEGRRAALDAMHLVPFAQEELREIGAVLPGYSSDQCSLSHYYSPWMAATAIATL